jgi:hypothetical protein
LSQFSNKLVDNARSIGIILKHPTKGTKMLTYIKSKNSYTVYVGPRYCVFDNTHEKYTDLISALQAEDVDRFLEVFDKKVSVLLEWSSGNFQISNGVLKYGNITLDDELYQRVESMISNGFNVAPMLAFIERLYKNPSAKSVKALYNFLANKGLPLTPDGYFIAHKGVVKSDKNFTDIFGRQVVVGDYVDKYSRTIRNNVGDENIFPRNQVDDNNDNACSFGLHVGTHSYATNWADHVITVKVDPADAVAVPNCEHEKLRTCRYVVVETLEKFDSDVVNS